MIIGHHAIVGGRDQAARRIDDARHVLMRDPALPVMLAGPAGHRQPAVLPWAPRHTRAHPVANRAMDVGRDQVVIDDPPATRRLIQRRDAVGGGHPRQAVERQIGLGELHRTQCERVA